MTLFNLCFILFYFIEKFVGEREINVLDGPFSLLISSALIFDPVSTSVRIMCACDYNRHPYKYILWLVILWLVTGKKKKNKINPI